MRASAQKTASPTSRPRLVDRPLPKDDPRQRCPDITKAKTLLGFAPSISLEQGLVPIIAYFRRRLANPSAPARAGPQQDQGAWVSAC